MAVNFCHDRLGTKILCSQVSTDSHDVSNLISRNFVSRNRGFLADSFVRPPGKYCKPIFIPDCCWQEFNALYIISRILIFILSVCFQVDIIVQFPHHIRLCCVTINGLVGTQQSTGCEVFVQSEDNQSKFYQHQQLPPEISSCIYGPHSNVTRMNQQFSLF
jgi:hypothetical protein